MKRPLSEEDKDANKKPKPERPTSPESYESVLLDENLLYEILRHVDDGRTLARSAVVCRQWRRTAHDERIWEQICIRDSRRFGSPLQLRTVVSALGGFRRLYSSHLWPLLKPPPPPPQAATSSSGSSSWPGLPPVSPQLAAPAPMKARWGNDEVNLSLSLLSIKHFMKMSSSDRNK